VPSVVPPVTRAVLVPIKAFSQAKLRLSSLLDDEERAHLARRMAAGVLLAAKPEPAFVVCDDQAVARWSQARGATVIWTPALGLNPAVGHGVSELARMGFDLVTVAHGDLPLIGNLSGVGRPGTVVLAPDRHGMGTNVAAVPTTSGFRFSYGTGSFERHRREAVRIGLDLQVLDRDDLAWDIDVPDDLRQLPRAVAPTPEGAPCPPAT
jgi:2-phospho-L-lactate guanylyltransferase